MKERNRKLRELAEACRENFEYLIEINRELLNRTANRKKPLNKQALIAISGLVVAQNSFIKQAYKSFQNCLQLMCNSSDITERLVLDDAEI